MATACSRNDQKSAEVRKSNEQILEDVDMIMAIGKVVPATDWAVIAGNTAARIREIHVREGDTVTKGQELIVLDNGNAELDVAEAKEQLLRLQAEHRVTLEDIRKATLQADLLYSKFETSRRLFDHDAETREVLELDKSNWQQQQRQVEALRANLEAQRVSERVQSLQTQMRNNTLADFRLTAPENGIIIEMSAKVGQHLNGGEELGRIVDTAVPEVEAEVDELFANNVRNGQTVYLFTVGRSDTLAQGRVSYVSPVLSEKSVLYETANEGEDRRVRKIRVQIAGNPMLPINAKVDCRIKIK